MTMPFIETLRKANWAASSPEHRLEALNQLENWMASQDGREPCPVSSLPLDPRTRGQHEYFTDGHEEISLNQNLVNSEEPYQAVETLLHEGRHSYQVHVAKRTELAESDQQLQDWSMAHEGGYTQPNSLEPSKYRMQPTELDARATARERTDNLYESVLQDEDYGAYKAQKLHEEAHYIEEARIELGDNYEQVARQAVQERYQQSHGIQLEQSSQPAPNPISENKSEPVQAETNQIGPSFEKGNEPTLSQEKPLSYETYNQLRDKDLEFYEQLSDHAAEMEKKGLTSVAEEQKQEMRLTLERLNSTIMERDKIYDPTGKPREPQYTQENPSSQIDTKPDQALKSDKTESIDQDTEQATASEGIPIENPAQENSPMVTSKGQALENSIGENTVLESPGKNAVEETVASTLVHQGEASIGAVVPEISEGMDNLSQAVETATPEAQSTSDVDPDSNEESEDEAYRYGLGF